MHSLNLMLPKEERKAMLLRLFHDDSPLVDHSQERRLAQESAKQSASRYDETIASTDETSKATGANTDSADAEPETLVDADDGGVKLNADVDGEIQDEEATAPGVAGGMGTEEDAMAREDGLKAEQQVDVDEQQTVAAAPEREGEEDRFNRTV